jgi:dihydroxyacetone kinase-like protein
MNGPALRQILVDALPRLADAREELRDLDAAIGDGDLGITVSKSCQAAVVALGAEPPDKNPASLIRRLAPVIATANPSTFSALVSGALLAAAKTLADVEDAAAGDFISAGRVAAETIAARGKAAVGDKTLLDALAPSLDAAAEHPENPLHAAVLSARVAVEGTKTMASTKGRAAWLGERTRGHPDPGATAYLRLLEALEAASGGAPAAAGPTET